MPVLAIACLVGLFFPLLSEFYVEWDGMLVWLLDLAVHWQWLFLIGLLFAGAVLTWRNFRWVMLFLAAPLPYLTASAQAPHVAAEGNTFTVASANVSLSNREPSTLVEWITMC